MHKLLPEPLKMDTKCCHNWEMDTRLNMGIKNAVKAGEKRTQNYDKSRENGHKFMTIWENRHNDFKTVITITIGTRIYTNKDNNTKQRD